MYSYIHEYRVIPNGQHFSHLRNGIAIPQMVLGTGGIDPTVIDDAITFALQHGYRYLDVADEYNTESTVASILARNITGLPRRRDVFIQSKLAPRNLGFLPTLYALRDSLSKLKTSYLDSYLIHAPA